MDNEAKYIIAPGQELYRWAFRFNRTFNLLGRKTNLDGIVSY